MGSQIPTQKRPRGKLVTGARWVRATPKPRPHLTALLAVQASIEASRRRPTRSSGASFPVMTDGSRYC